MIFAPSKRPTDVLRLFVGRKDTGLNPDCLTDFTTTLSQRALPYARPARVKTTLMCGEDGRLGGNVASVVA